MKIIKKCVGGWVVKVFENVLCYELLPTVCTFCLAIWYQGFTKVCETRSVRSWEKLLTCNNWTKQSKVALKKAHSTVSMNK